MCCKNCARQKYCKKSCYKSRNKRRGDTPCRDFRGAACMFCAEGKAFDIEKYEKKTLKKLEKLASYIADYSKYLPVAEYVKQLTKVGGENRKYQIELLDERINIIHREIKKLRLIHKTANALAEAV